MNCAMHKEIRSEKAFSRKNEVDLPNAGVCFIIPSHYFLDKMIGHTYEACLNSLGV